MRNSGEYDNYAFGTTYGFFVCAINTSSFFYGVLDYISVYTPWVVYMDNRFTTRQRGREGERERERMSTGREKRREREEGREEKKKSARGIIIYIILV